MKKYNVTKIIMTAVVFIFIFAFMPFNSFAEGDQTDTVEAFLDSENSFTYGAVQTQAYTGEDLIKYDSINVSHKMIGKPISAKKSPYVIVTYEKDDTIYQEDGILISKKHVIIGAHGMMCEYPGSLKRIYVTAGDEEINVVEYNMPATFECDNTCRTDDIMILTLEKPVKSNKSLPILKSGKKIKRGTKVQIAGFGGDPFGTLRQSNIKIENKYSEGLFLLSQYYGNNCYLSDAEGSPAVTVKVKNKKGKKTKAIVGITTCFYVDRKGFCQDMLMTLQNKNTKAFIKKVVGKGVKFM